MKKEDELASPDSCLNRARDGEPVFVLRANDECAPDAVRRWAAFYKAQKQRSRGWDERAQAKWREAMGLADDMQRWRMANVVVAL